MEEKLCHGCAYYPELWDEKEIGSDIRHMKQCGINVVRMGEFAWYHMEPEDGSYDFKFFVNVSNKLYENGIETILCTPTATPPVWMSYGHEERLFHNRQGRPLSHGSRQHFCMNQSYFRKKSRDIAEKLAQAAADLPGLIGWQIDNELKCHVAECYCPSCVSGWRKWLEEKYGDIDSLNSAWGTGVWSQHYPSFDQIQAPVETPFLHNPSLIQSFKLFAMKKASEYCHMQAEGIRKYSQKPITHNTGETFGLDNPQLFSALDFAAFDDYAPASRYPVMLRSYDYFRMIKKEVPFWVMETSPNHNGCVLGAAPPHPAGYLKAEAAAAYIAGARGFSYWLFRQQRAGCEIPHGSLLYAWGSPTPGYKEAQEVGRIKEQLEPYLLATKMSKSRIAVMYSELSRVHFDVEPFEDYHYWEMIQSVYEEDIPHDIGVDMIHEESDLIGYEMVYTPFYASIEEEWLRKIMDYVAAGGIWINGPMCNYRTPEHTVSLAGGMGKLEEMTGVKVKYMQSFTGSESKGSAYGVEARLSMLGCVFDVPKEWSAGLITSGDFSGETFIARQELGKGKIIFVGARPPLGQDHGDFMQNLILKNLKDKPTRFQSSQNVKTYLRSDARDSDYLFAVEMEGKIGSIELNGKYKLLMGGKKKESATLQILPYETMVIILE